VFNCGNDRAIGYFLEALVMLAPFCKEPINVTLQGITNDNVDPSVENFYLLFLICYKSYLQIGRYY
jgi:RNA 3'-terminal phosphate cyclase